MNIKKPSQKDAKAPVAGSDLEKERWGVIYCDLRAQLQRMSNGPSLSNTASDNGKVWQLSQLVLAARWLFSLRREITLEEFPDALQERDIRRFLEGFDERLVELMKVAAQGEVERSM